MAKVLTSANLTDPHCLHMAGALAQVWQADLTQMGSTGEFVVGHGKDGTCKDIHSTPFNGNFWIWTRGRGCKVFLSQRKGQPRDYAGAGRVPAGTYRGSGHCTCRQGH